MKFTELTKYLGGSADNVGVADPFWNNVLLLLRLDGHTNTKGLPFYRDYSRYQYHVRYRAGSSTSDSSAIKTVPNLSTSNSLYIPSSNSINVPSFTYLPNSLNRSARINEINSRLVNTVNPNYLDVRLNGNPGFELGQSDFTLELSFYAEELNLPWKFQTLIAAGRCLYVNGGDIVNPASIGSYISFPPTSVTTGYGLFIESNKLKFFADNVAYSIYAPNLVINTWYHVAIQRQGNVLKTFINGQLQSSLNFNHTLDMYYVGQENDDYYKTIQIGATSPFSSYNSVYGVHGRQVETAFSGAISNIRLTKNARYLSSFYTVNLPHPVVPVQNKIDADYSNTLLNIPCTYDYFDYSSKRAHIQSKALLKTIPSLASHSLHLNGNAYTTKNINTNLDSDDWCLEFYIIPYVNNAPLHLVNSPITASTDYTYNVLTEGSWRKLLFDDFNLDTVYGEELDETVPLIRITTSQQKKILDLDMKVQSRRYYNQDYNKGVYFAAKVSTNGDSWVIFPSESGTTITTSPVSYLPDEEIKFAGNFSHNYGTDIEPNSDVVAGAYSQNRYHIAVQKTNQNIYFFINGVLNKTLSINTPLYTEGNIEVVIGGDYIPLTGKREYYTANANGDYIGQSTNFYLTFGLSGIRLTNASRYDVSATNDVQYDNSLQPLPLSVSALPPSRARIIDIVRDSPVDTVSTQSVAWLVYTNQDVDNLTTVDFTVTPEAGLAGASVTSLTKLSNFQYKLVADVGTGNGTLTPNFNDVSTVLYGDTLTPISYYSGELSISGEAYKVYKTKPSAILESGSNPYVNGKFLVYLQFDAPIVTFNISNVGIENAAITKHRKVAGVSGRYELEITPLTEGVINIKALEGCGVSDTALPSSASNTLTRVFKSYFPIMQLPLNIGNAFSDISPTRAVFKEVITNNTSYSTISYPLGDTSSMSIDSLAEQGGFRCESFNAVGGLLNVDNNVDWTLEFFLRVNSTATGTSKRAHIFSIEDSLGLSISASNGKLVIGRNPAQLSNLFSDVVFPDRDTPAFIEAANPLFTSQQKFPHFAITKKGDIYRFYVNGKRVGISKNSILFNITKGKVNVGYYPVNINDVPYLMSNLRITYGKALYTSASINVPYLPYDALPNITDYAEVLNYVSIYSTNTNSQVAKAGDIVKLKFSSIVPLPVVPVVTVQGNSVGVSKENNNYVVDYIVTPTDQDGTCTFSITIPAQLGINSTVFTKTTNNSYVVVDNSELEVILDSDTPNNSNHVVPLIIKFSETVPGFTLNKLSLTNCVASNLYRIPNTYNYSCTLTGISSGTIQASILANQVIDLAGNYNLVSNVFTRTVTVPAYIPDTHWDNVTLLLQPSSTQSIVDVSDAGAQLVNNGVTITASNSPSGLSTSMYFDGNSSLNITGQSLALSERYTVEMFIYSESLTSIRLPAPTLYPANDISPTEFTLSWGDVNVPQYQIDIATDSAFTNPLPGYKQKTIGNTLSYKVKGSEGSNAPKLASTVAVGSKGFVIKWVDSQKDTIAYKLDISKNEIFTDTLTAYLNRLSTDTYLEVGNTAIGNVEKVVTSSVNPSTSVSINNTPLRSGHILTGLLKDGTGYPQLDYFLEESSIRLYGNDKYYSAAVAEDIEISKWLHVAIVNDNRYTYLYVEGELVDRIKNTGFSSNLVMGHSLGFFKGYITGVRITKGVSRYSGTAYNVPSLPFPIN